MTRLSRITALSLAILCGYVATAAHAADVTFTFDAGDNGLTTISKTVDSITLILSNPSTKTTFRSDSDGLGVGYGPEGSSFIDGELSSFQLQVTGAYLTFVSYQLGWAYSSPNMNFSMSGGSGTSTANPLQTVGTYTPNGNWGLAPSQTGTMTISGFGTDDSDFAQFKSMTFSYIPVPEPSTYALGAIATGVMAFAARRRKSLRA